MMIIYQCHRCAALSQIVIVIRFSSYIFTLYFWIPVCLPIHFNKVKDYSHQSFGSQLGVAWIALTDSFNDD